MTRFVIAPEVALHLAAESIVLPGKHKLLAPTLLRSQVLSQLYQAVRRNELTQREANRRLKHIRGLRLRLLGDRALQDEAWKIATELGWSDTLDAEYLALTRLQADAFVTLDPQLARSARTVVSVAQIDDVLTAPER